MIRQLGWRASLQVLVSRVFPLQAHVLATPPGIKYPVTLRTNTTDIDSFRQIFVTEVYAFRLKREPRVILDAGANIGLSAVYFANRYPEATILAVEPESGNFRMLLCNTRGYRNILPIQAALWNASTPVPLVDPGIGQWGFRSWRDSTGESGRSAGTARGLTVDEIMEDHGLSAIDFVKLDIEGAEKEVFENSSSWMPNVGAVAAELHEEWRPGCSRAFREATAAFEYRSSRGQVVLLARSGWVESGTAIPGISETP